MSVLRFVRNCINRPIAEDASGAAYQAVRVGGPIWASVPYPRRIAEMKDGKSHGYGWVLPVGGERGTLFEYAYGRFVNLNSYAGIEMPTDTTAARLLDSAEKHLQQSKEMRVRVGK